MCGGRERGFLSLNFFLSSSSFLLFAQRVLGCKETTARLRFFALNSLLGGSAKTQLHMKVHRFGGRKLIPAALGAPDIVSDSGESPAHRP